MCFGCGWRSLALPDNTFGGQPTPDIAGARRTNARTQASSHDRSLAAVRGLILSRINRATASNRKQAATDIHDDQIDVGEHGDAPDWTGDRLDNIAREKGHPIPQSR